MLLFNRTQSKLDCFLVMISRGNVVMKMRRHQIDATTLARRLLNRVSTTQGTQGKKGLKAA